MKKSMMTIVMAAACAVYADDVRLADGSVLRGTVAGIGDKTLTLKTDVLGKVEIPREKIVGMTIDNPSSVRLNDGTVLEGQVGPSDAGKISVEQTNAASTAEIAQVKHIWANGSEDPQVTAQRRKWKTDITLAASGKSGNTDEKDYVGKTDSVLSGPVDETKLYTRYNRSETDNEKSTDESIGGAQYSWYLTQRLGWYVRGELEKDEFENIELRSTVGTGPSYRWVNKEHFTLSGRSGVFYRNEKYEDGASDEDTQGVDFGLSHFYRFKNRWKVNNELTYAPAFDDLENYQAVQDSSLAMPVGGTDFWNVKMGVRNSYNSKPVGDFDKLDTTWYAGLGISH